MYSEAELNNLFDYHAPSQSQQEKYTKLNNASKEYARVILECCPDCADRDRAILKLRELRMQANMSIACNE